jgi:hypothetical protein
MGCPIGLLITFKIRQLSQGINGFLDLSRACPLCSVISVISVVKCSYVCLIFVLHNAAEASFLAQCRAID